MFPLIMAAISMAQKKAQQQPQLPTIKSVYGSY